MDVVIFLRCQIERKFPNFLTPWKRSAKDTHKSHFVRHISYAWWHPNWQGFDQAWLVVVRDSYMRSLLKSSTLQNSPWNPVPLYDLVRGLCQQRHDDALIPATYHCFSQISELALQPPTYHGSRFTNLADLCRQSAYLQDLMVADGEALLPNYLMLPKTPSDQTSSMDVLAAIVNPLIVLLHQQNMESFTPGYVEIDLTKWKLRLCLLKYFFQASIAPSENTRLQVPQCFLLERYDLAWIVLFCKSDVEQIAGMSPLPK